MAQREWHPEEIRAELRKRYKTVRAFAKSVNYALSSVCDVLSGKFLPGVQAAIAATLERSKHELWPHHFNPDDTPKRGRHAVLINGNDSGKNRGRNGQSRRIA